MPSLATQIETLYRVIGQLPQRDSGNRRDPLLPGQFARPALLPGHAARGTHQVSSPPSGRSFPPRWLCSFYCLWFSLPLSVWLSSGWFGLLLYWQALSSVACLVEFAQKFTRKPSFALRARDPRDGAAPCTAIELEAQ
jgi:hypothetical protein